MGKRKCIYPSELQQSNKQKQRPQIISQIEMLGKHAIFYLPRNINISIMRKTINDMLDGDDYRGLF